MTDVCSFRGCVKAVAARDLCYICYAVAVLEGYAPQLLVANALEKL